MFSPQSRTQLPPEQSSGLILTALYLICSATQAEAKYGYVMSNMEQMGVKELIS